MNDKRERSVNGKDTGANGTASKAKRERRREQVYTAAGIVTT